MMNYPLLNFLKRGAIASAMLLISAGSVSAEDAAVSPNVANKFGFASYIEQDAELYLTLYDVKEQVESFSASPWGEMIAESNGTTVEALLADERWQKFASIAGEEVFVGVGAIDEEAWQGAKQFHLLYTKFQLASLIQSSTDLLGVQMPEGVWEQMREDKELITSAVEKIQSYPVYFGARVSDAEARDEALQLVRQQFDEWLVELEPYMADLESHSTSLDQCEGKVLDLELASDALWKNMIGDLAEDSSGQGENPSYLMELFRELLKGREAYLMTGTIGDYVVGYIGLKQEDFDIALQVEDSLLVSDAYAGVRQYAGKEMYGTIFMSEEYAQYLASTSGEHEVLSYVQESLDMMTSMGVFTVDEATKQAVADFEMAVSEIHQGVNPSEITGVVYREDGVKFEMSTAQNPALDAGDGLKLASMGATDDALLTFNVCWDEEYAERTQRVVSTGSHALLQLLKSVSTMNTENEDMNASMTSMRQALGTFDVMAKPIIQNLWSAWSVDVCDGLGNESLLLIDSNGTLPASMNMYSGSEFEGLPFPRVRWFAEVESRESLGKGWRAINQSLSSALAMANMPAPSYKQVEEDLYSTWKVSFGTPEIDDYLPSVNLNNELFILNLYGSGAEDAFGQYADLGEPGEGGLYVRLDMVHFNDMLQQWHQKLSQKVEDQEGEAEALVKYQQTATDLQSAIEVIDVLEAIELESHDEGGKSHLSLHFDTKDVTGTRTETEADTE